MPRIQHKRGTSANLASVNPTPLAGELVWDSTENAIKIGDGATAWTSLAYVTATPRTHTHSADAITSGTVAYARLPVGSTASTVCAGDDARLSDARSPTAHKSSHATGGSDALTPADIGAAPAASPTFTGVITVAATSGSAGSYAPSLCFASDPNTGFGQLATDTASIFTAGHERLRVDSSGRVGINTATLVQTFNVSGTSQFAGDIRILKPGGDVISSCIYIGNATGARAFNWQQNSDGFSLDLWSYDGSAWERRVRFKNTGAVRFIPLAADPPTGSQAGDVYYNSASNELRYHNGSAFVGAAPAASPAITGNATFSASSGVPVTITNTGTGNSFVVNDGAGDTTPFVVDASGRMTVGGRAWLSQTLSGEMTFLGHNIRASATTANAAEVVNGSWVSSLIKMYFSEGITFHTSSTNYAAGNDYPLASTERMRIAAGGNVGIGTNNPASRLDVNGVITVSATSGSAGSYLPSLTFSGDANTGFGQVSGQSDSASVFTAGHERVRVKSTGAVRFVPLTADPGTADAGDVYYNSSTNKLRVYDGTSWVDLH